MRINDSTLYLTDNGAALCGEHLGSSAKHTGRDISGQEILPFTPEMVRTATALYGYVPCCETCGRSASILHTAGV
jgi:hypothetical protein